MPAYKKDRMDLLKKQKSDYDLLCANPPAEVTMPTEELDAEKDADIQATVKFIEELTNEIITKKRQQNVLSTEIDEFEDLITKVAEVAIAIDDIKNRIEKLKPSNSGLDKWMLEFTVDLESLKHVCESKREERSKLTNLVAQYTDEIPQIDEQDAKNSYNSLLQKAASLDYKKKLAEAYKSLLTNETTFAQRQYQKYLDDKKEWEDKKIALFGDEQTKDTIKYLEKEIDYVSKELHTLLKGKRDGRLEIAARIYECFMKKVEVYNAIYLPIKEKIGKLLGGIDDEVSFVAGVSARKDLTAEITKRINKKIKSQLYGVDGDKKLNDIFDSTTFSEKESSLQFVGQILDCITEETDIGKIVKNDERLEFCNYIAGLSYLDVDFILTMGELKLEEMSPGQRGTVLLIFYLALDKDDTPLIIDQPEDNLDNQSVFDKLVPCILAAKKTRQIIIVTHNPNIAIACDSEQIISCKIDKHTHKITYVSGAIEETEIKNSVVKILEGTQPAFDLRNRKYSFYGDKAATP